MNEDGFVEYNFDEIIEYLVSKGVCSEEEALVYLEAEDAYYDSIGLNVYIESGDADDSSENARDASGDTSQDPGTSMIVDQHDVEAYITENTDLDQEKVEKISLTVYDFLEENDFFA